MTCRLVVLLPVALLGGCSFFGGESYQSKNGITYDVERLHTIDPKDLPTNSALKMLDNDVVRFAAQTCELDNDGGADVERCDLYVQPSREGTLVGYVTLKQFGHRAILRSVANCFLAGDLKFFETENQPLVNDIAKDFYGQVFYAAWERGPGDVLLSLPDDGTMPEGDDDFANGIWVVTRKGDNLNIAQDKWNYCDRSKAVDEVFTRIVTLKNPDIASRTKALLGGKGA